MTQYLALLKRNLQSDKQVISCGQITQTLCDAPQLSKAGHHEHKQGAAQNMHTFDKGAAQPTGMTMWLTPCAVA